MILNVPRWVCCLLTLRYKWCSVTVIFGSGKKDHKYLHHFSKAILALTHRSKRKADLWIRSTCSGAFVPISPLWIHQLLSNMAHWFQSLRFPTDRNVHVEPRNDRARFEGWVDYLRQWRRCHKCPWLKPLILARGAIFQLYISPSHIYISSDSFLTDCKVPSLR